MTPSKSFKFWLPWDSLGSPFSSQFPPIVNPPPTSLILLQNWRLLSGYYSLLVPGAQSKSELVT